MDAWEQAKRLADRHQPSSQNLFVRLQNHGDKITGVFLGAPYPRDVVWTGERYELFDSQNPAHSVEGRKPTLRVALNFYDTKEGVMRIFEGGTAWMRDVLKVKEKYGLDRWSFEIERHGEAGDPKTKYTILPEEKLSDDDRATIAKVALHDLAVLTGSRSAPTANSAVPSRSASPAALPAQGASPPSAAHFSAAPVTMEGKVDLATATQIAERLRVLPRSAVDGFLAEMSIRRVRELNADDVSRAMRVLERLEGGGGEEQGDVDPFA